LKCYSYTSTISSGGQETTCQPGENFCKVSIVLFLIQKYEFSKNIIFFRKHIHLPEELMHLLDRVLQYAHLHQFLLPVSRLAQFAVKKIYATVHRILVHQK
jgi:hypothetical protein